MANCIVCIDFQNAIRPAFNKWLKKYKKNNKIASMTQGDVEAVILKEILDKLARLKKRECEKVILIFVYHLDPKKLTIKPRDKQTYFESQKAAVGILDTLSTIPNLQGIDELVLNSCHSSDYSSGIRDSAFKLPALKKVITQNTTCAASCSTYMTGLGWDSATNQPTFLPVKNRIDVWTSPKDMTSTDIDAKEKYNINTGDIEPWLSDTSP